MPQINLSFPDQSYSSTNKPSISTLKADLLLLQNTINALDNDNIVAAAGIVYSKLNLTASIVNADIASAAAIAMTKLADYVPPTDFTPVMTSSGGGFDLGNGVARGRYTKSGKKLTIDYAITFGTTTNFGSGSWRLSTPITIVSTFYVVCGNARAFQSGVQEVDGGTALILSSTTIAVADPTGGQYSASTPFVWVANSNNTLYVHVECEAA